MTDLRPTVTVGADALYRALVHGIELWNDESTPTFRLDQRDGRSGFTRYVNARVEGKLAEEAFVHFLDEYYGIEATVDYDVYGSIEETDDGDVKHVIGDDGEPYPPSTHVDVKKTKRRNSWLAIRTSTYNRHPDGAPFVLTKLTIEDDIDLDTFEGDTVDDIEDDLLFQSRVVAFAEKHFPLEVDLVGTAYKDEFTDEFHKGDRLYHPKSGNKIGGPLRRDNMAIPCDDLIATEQRWDRVVDEITTDIPVEYKPLSDD